MTEPQKPTRFDDVLLDALAAIQAIAERGKGWEGALAEEKGRAVELDRGLAGERRYALSTKNEAMLTQLEALKRSAEAQLRMLDGRTAPGDEELAVRLDADRAAYEKLAHEGEAAPP
jgi:hypothetical protein